MKLKRQLRFKAARSERCRRRLVLASGMAAVAVLSCGAVLAMGAQPAQAKAYSQELRIEMPNGVKYATTTFKADLSRDGKADIVKVKPVMKNTASGSHGIKVYVKGKKALELEAKTGSARFSLYYVHMSKKLEFLAIAQPRGKKDAFTPGKLVLYRYGKGKLAEVADLSEAWGVIGRPSHSAVKGAGKGHVTVTAYFDKSPLGARSFALSYAYDAATKSFGLATKSAKPVVTPRHWTASVKETLYQEAAPAKIKMLETVVRDPSSESGAESTTTTKTRYVKNKRIATMKKGAKVTGVAVHRDGYVKVKLNNGKSGWFKWGKYRKGKPFKEVGAGY